MYCLRYLTCIFRKNNKLDDGDVFARSGVCCGFGNFHRFLKKTNP